MKISKKIRTSDLFVGKIVGTFARELAKRIDDAATKATGLSSSTCHAIIQIGSEPCMSIERLRKMLELQHSSVVRLVSRLETQGLVDRAKGKGSDMRQLSISLTDTGEQYFSRIILVQRDVLDNLMAGLDKSEAENLLDLVLKLIPKMVLPGNDENIADRLNDMVDDMQDGTPDNFIRTRHGETPKPDPEGKNKPVFHA